MRILEESELILRPDGRIYHLDLHPEELADTVILVGDPGRVQTISAHFDTIEVKRHNREIVTHTGKYKGKDLTVMSTGMGTDNIDIIINELDALVNIDLKNRVVKEERKALNLIRLGTSGGLQEDVQVDTMVISEYGLGLDGLLSFYEGGNEIIEHSMTNAFISKTGWPLALPRPYIVKAPGDLFDKLQEGLQAGITATAPGFYGPQGRALRLNAAFPDLNDRLNAFAFQDKRIYNFEMETSAIYSMGALMGHNAATVCAVIANRLSRTYSKDYKKVVAEMIELVLGKLLHV
jgi:uridine phosphorylase